MFFAVTRNDISPTLTALARTAKNPLPVLRAMGTTFKSITEGNFSSLGAAYRPTPWAPKWDGSKSNLTSRNPTLSRAFALEVTSTYAKLSNPMPYAGIHQFGGTIKAKTAKALRFKLGDRWVTVKSVYIPPRPFFPVVDGKLTPKAEEKIARAGERAVLRQASQAS